MRRAIAVLAVSIVALVAAGARAESPSPSVDPALQSAVAKFGQAFDAADPKAFASFFASDATVMNPMGATAHGPAQIQQLFAKDGAQIFKGSRSTLTITGTRQLGPDFVWLDIDHQVQNARLPNGTRGTMKPHMVLLAEKQGGEWKWAELRALIPRPRGPAYGPRPK